MSTFEKVQLAECTFSKLSVALDMQEIWRAMVKKSFHPNEWFIMDDSLDEQQLEVTFMWVYKRNDSENSWEVGYYSPDKQWNKDSTYSSREQARAMVHYLNGGGTK
jgi:hypothetical protein